MKSLKLTSNIEANFETVVENFSEDLLTYLNPPFPKAVIEKYEGNTEGAEVAIKLDFLLFTQRWISEITKVEKGSDYFQFIDEGRKLPFFLSRWQHIHRIEKAGDNKTRVIDHVSFSWYHPVLTFLILPAIYFQFAYRKPRYNAYFKGIR